MENFDIKKSLRELQAEALKEREKELADLQAKHEAYLQSEKHLRDVWEAGEKRWLAKAQREGWHYTPKPFPSSNDKLAEIEKQLKELLAKIN